MLYLPDFPRTPSQIRAALESRRLSQQSLARMIGVAPRTVRRWCDTRAGEDRSLPSGAIAMIGLALIRYDAQDAQNAQDAGDAPTASTNPKDAPPSTGISAPALSDPDPNPSKSNP